VSCSRCAESGGLCKKTVAYLYPNTRTLEDSAFQPTPEQVDLLHKFEGDLQTAMLGVLRTAPTLSDYVLFPSVNQPLKDAVEHACAEYVGPDDFKHLVFTYEEEDRKVLVTVNGPPEVMAKIPAGGAARTPRECISIDVDVELAEEK